MVTGPKFGVHVGLKALRLLGIRYRQMTRRAAPRVPDVDGQQQVHHPRQRQAGDDDDLACHCRAPGRKPLGMSKGSLEDVGPY